MKKLLLLAITVLALASAAAPAQGAVNLLISGSAGNDVLSIKPSQDGRFYILDALSPLEVGGGLCTHIEGRENSLSCEAVAIAGFEVNTGAGEDQVIISPKIAVPATLRGGPGNDRLRGGGGADKIVGGSGDDALLGSNGDDLLIGEAGNDWLFGQGGSDRLLGGPGDDWLNGGAGNNSIVEGPGNDTVGPNPPASKPVS